METVLEIEYLDIPEDEKYEELARRVISQCFRQEQLSAKMFYVNVILTTPEHIRKLNKQYRGFDKETDVLSFPMFEKEELINIDLRGQEVLGDIVISMERVKEQAEEYGHSKERELAYMLVHGFYHLMGEDHMEDEEKRRMRTKEEVVLKALKIER